MFSSMIQNLLTSSGKSSAMQRAVQMNNYVNNLNSQWTPVEKNANATPELNNDKIQSFDSVLKKSAQVKFGDLLTNPSTRVNANIYSAKAETATDKISTREQIKGLVSRISKKHGVDEKLVNALIKQESGFCFICIACLFCRFFKLYRILFLLVFFGRIQIKQSRNHKW